MTWLLLKGLLFKHTYIHNLHRSFACLNQAFYIFLNSLFYFILSLTSYFIYCSKHQEYILCIRGSKSDPDCVWCRRHIVPCVCELNAYCLADDEHDKDVVLFLNQMMSICSAEGQRKKISRVTGRSRESWACLVKRTFSTVIFIF